MWCSYGPCDPPGLSTRMSFAPWLLCLLATNPAADRERVAAVSLSDSARGLPGHH